MVEEFGRRRDYITKRLNAMGLSCLKPEGAFYVFSEISAFLGKQYKGRKIKNSVDFSEILLEEAKVAVVPGAAFGMDDHIRFSYATSMENIEKGLWRLEDFLKGVN
jgi:aspartate aminotransferase